MRRIISWIGVVALLCMTGMMGALPVAAEGVGVDITADFTDPVFLDFVYDLVGKTAPTPIYDTDVAEITEVHILTGELRSLESLAGIEHFTMLKILACSNTYKLTDLDVSHNLALEKLYCYRGLLTTLDVSHNTALKVLHCYENNLNALDVSHNIHLEELVCDDNELGELDLSFNTELETLLYGNTGITTIDLTHNPLLGMLVCNANNLTELPDLSHNPALYYLGCYDNRLTSVDVSHNPDLEYLMCRNNQITALDVSHNPLLQYLWCTENNMSDPSNIVGLSAKIDDFKFYPQNQSKSILLGDIAFKGTIDSTDARMALQYEVGLIPLDNLQQVLGDVDANGKVDSTDARLILQREVGLLSHFPAYMVVCDANGGTPNEYVSSAQSALLGDSITLNFWCTRKGYEFLGWATVADATVAEYQLGDEYIANTDTTLYAVWRATA